MNQASGRYDMTAEEAKELAAATREAVLDSMRVDPERNARRIEGSATPEAKPRRGGKGRASSQVSSDDEGGDDGRGSGA
jgi:hypothetical protein